MKFRWKCQLDTANWQGLKQYQRCFSNFMVQIKALKNRRKWQVFLYFWTLLPLWQICCALVKRSCQLISHLFAQTSHLGMMKFTELLAHWQVRLWRSLMGQASSGQEMQLNATSCGLLATTLTMLLLPPNQTVWQVYRLLYNVVQKKRTKFTTLQPQMLESCSFHQNHLLDNKETK